MAEPVLAVRHLSKSFQTPEGRLRAVDGVSLSLGEGRTLGIVGESGSGKTTLGRCMLRLVEPDAGEILYRGENILHLKRAEMRRLRQKMQMVFQNPFSSLDPRMTVSQTLSEILRVNGVCRDKTAVEERIRMLMEMVGLEERILNRYPHELDGGRCQRLGIARALATEPDVIICDEPVSALDVSIQAQILNLLLELKNRLSLSLVFISHDLAVIRQLADETAVMYGGRIVEQAPTEELFSHPFHPYTKALLSAVPVPELVRERPRIVLRGEVTPPINPADECRFAGRCPSSDRLCRASVPELSEIRPGHLAACHFADSGSECRDKA